MEIATDPTVNELQSAVKEEVFANAIANGSNVREALAACELSYSPNNYKRFNNPRVIKRVQELLEMRLKAAGISAERTKHEIARVAYADVRKIFTPEGLLKPIHEIDDDTAAAITSITVQRKNIGTMKEPEFVDVMKYKFASKMDALGLLAKHFKIVNDEGDGVNALANALADRLNAAHKRAPVVEEVTDVTHRPVVVDNEPQLPEGIELGDEVTEELW